MNICILLVSGLSCVYGLFTSLRPKTPLFYKIVTYGFGSYFLGTAYSILYTTLVPGNTGFHAGYLGYVGTFFFLFSSYFGALDRLADGRETAYRIYRIAALIPSFLIIICGGTLWKRLLLLPVAATAYFTCKHLVLPDVDMGIIRVMRPYNAVLLLFCLLQPFTMGLGIGSHSQSFPNLFLDFLNLIFILLALLLARKGVQKWFI